jgi:beta-xylosidase
MRSVGVHQGLAPVLDVVRDPRWGRVEETIGEDPYLVGSVATAYIKGLEGAGIVATLKHFVGYSGSKAARNLAPVSIGRRELADVLLPPFEMAIRESGVRSVMHAYTDIDGVPSAADEELLTGLLRDTWGFEGTVVADYFGIAFLRTLHAIAGSWEEAAEQALTAGVDVELPTVKAYGAPLCEAVREGRIEEELVDRALGRVLTQKIQLGLLDPDWSPVPEALQDADLADTSGLRGSIDLDNDQNRALARELAEQAVVLLSNDGILPLAAPRRIAVIGPTANDPMAVLGCYSFPAHVGAQHPEMAIGLRLPTLLESFREEFPASGVSFVLGTTIDGGDTDGISDAARAASDADLVILALGDRAGLFGRGTSGEGCDAGSLTLPGAQQALLDRVLAVGTPAVVVLLSGRPYALGAETRSAASAIVQAFFPGEEGTGAVAGVLSGRVNPSGRLPVSIPSRPDAQPSTYLAPALGRKTSVSNIDPTPAFAFGHGLSYTSFDWSDLTADADSMSTDGTVRLTVRIRNIGDRAGCDIVQLYLHDPVASVVRPLQRLIGYQRVDLEASEETLLTFEVPADLASFTGRDGRRIVEPGELVLGFGRSSADIVLSHTVTLTGPVRIVDHTRKLHPRCTIATP